MMTDSPALAGERVLIVEDEMLVALLLEDFLIAFGCIPPGPCSSVADALEAVRLERFDLAALDVKPGGKRADPVADALDTKQIPFLFVSGHGDQTIPPGRRGWTVCAKPFRAEDLAVMLSAVPGLAASRPQVRGP